MKVLVINCGSSSLKYQVLDMTSESLLAKGLVERIGMEGSVITHEKVGAHDKFKLEEPMKSHKEVIGHVLDAVAERRIYTLWLIIKWMSLPEVLIAIK